MPDFLTIAVFLGLALLVWDCVEVGRNDASNLVNAVFGARVMRRKTAVLIAGVAVVAGASFSAPVMETARKGIFDPTVLTIQMAVAIYISVYFVDTVLLYGFSGFGMPVSTTACLVFELTGAALFLAGADNVNWGKVGTVSSGIVVSILTSGLASFMVMRVFRGAIREKSQDRDTVLLHGPWITGIITTFLVWFMVFKGLKNVEAIKTLKAATFQAYGAPVTLLFLWGTLTLITHLFLVLGERKRLHRHLFPGTAVLGMICMAFAFGQNDLANAASPGLASLQLWQSGRDNPQALADIATEIPISMGLLFVCGVLMASGMFSTYAQRVTRAAVNTGSQFHEVALYAPRWTRRLARMLLGLGKPSTPLAPSPSVDDGGKKVHYDTLRASVITGVSASVIAFASGKGLPVSTTYVAFAAVLGSGFADRVFSRGDADRKVGRAIWVVFCWLVAPVIAVVATGLVALIVHGFSTAGLVIAIGLNLLVRTLLKKGADRHETHYHDKVSEKLRGSVVGGSDDPDAD